MLSDRDGRLTYISPSVARVTGYPPEILVGRMIRDLVHPEDWPAMERVGALLYAGEIDEDAAITEYRARHKDGRWLWFETRTSLVHDRETGEATGNVDVARDVTRRKALEDELRERTREAEAATEAKSDFLANMSHEIRTPLTAILGFSGLLKRLPGLPDEADLHLQRITTAGEALLSVVNDVLDFSKLEAGQLELDPQPFDPAAIVRETVDLVAAQAAMKGLRLCVDLADDLPSAVSADSARLRQILLNLLGNALKFTGSGDIRVTVAHVTDDGGRLRIDVADTGSGIPTDRLDRLFQRFSQVDGSISRQHGGSGLGLAICMGLTELMGGRIGVDSVEGEGSRFWFTIAAPSGTDGPTVEFRGVVFHYPTLPPDSGIKSISFRVACKQMCQAVTRITLPLSKSMASVVCVVLGLDRVRRMEMTSRLVVWLLCGFWFDGDS